MHSIQMIDLVALRTPPPVRRSTAGSRWAGSALAGLAGLVAVGLAIGVAGSGTDASAALVPAAPASTSQAAATPAADLPVSREAVLGLWFAQGDPLTGAPPLLARFTADGTVTLAGGSDEVEVFSGTYQVRPTGLTLSPTGGACEATENIAWHATVPLEGQLDVVHLGSAGDLRGQVGTCTIQVGDSWRFTRVSPSSPGTPDVVGGYSTPSGPVTAAAQAVGFWLGAEQGIVVRIDTAGRYVVYAGPRARAVDTGTLEVGSTEAVLVSDGAGECAPGARTTWTSVRIEDGGLRATVGEGGCAGGLSDEIVVMPLDTRAALGELVPSKPEVRSIAE